VAIEFLRTWTDAGIPAPDILRAMTINGYRVSDMETRRGPIRVGFPADLIAVVGNPLENIGALRQVPFVMKDGMVYKQDGVILVGEFLHGGPVNPRGGR
jgi:imidazolonepropionase-like amidohydrolase